MNSILGVWTAIANFARALNRLAAVADAVAAEVEQRVEVLDHRPASSVPQLGGEPAANGRKTVVRK